MTDGDLMAQTARRGSTVLVDAALGALVVAGVGLLLDWRSQAGDLGAAERTGYGAAPVFVLVAGGLALVLLGLARWRPHLPGWSGVAAGASTIAALGCIGGVIGDGEATSGPAPWLGLFAFGTAALCALLACLAPVGLEPADAGGRIGR